MINNKVNFDSRLNNVTFGFTSSGPLSEELALADCSSSLLDTFLRLFLLTVLGILFESNDRKGISKNEV